ncbi:MAG: glycosyltransferase family 9 protein [Chloroflexota bacterium]
MPDLRARTITSATWLAGLPWRVRSGRGKRLSLTDPHLKRVVVVKPCCMGDVLMSTPAIAALRRALPNSQIDIAVGGWSKQAVAHNPRLNALIEAPVGGDDTHMADYMRLARYIRRGKYGAALVLDRSPLMNMVPYLARVPVRAGLDSENRGLALTHPVQCPPNKVRHEVEWYLDVVRSLGIAAPRDESYLEFFPTEEEKGGAGRALSEAGCEEGDFGYVALHLGGGANPGMNLLSKRWQPERWARITDWLAETYETNVLLLGGPGKEDREAAEALKAALFPATQGYVVDMVGKLGWGEMGALIGRCNLFLGHDTGAMHMATAMRTPVVAVFGPTDPVRYGPWDPSRRSVAVAPKHATSGSGAESLRQASKSSDLYHGAVTIEGVWSAVEKIYARGVGKRAVE